MSAVQYIELARASGSARGLPPYQWTLNETAPFTPFEKNLEECRMALLSSGGVYIKERQRPFDLDGKGLAFREIPKDIDVAELAISHNGYDHTDADRDVNCIFPIERFRELEGKRYIGELAPVNYTIMGRILRRTALQNETAAEILRRLKEGGVDVLFLVPA